MPLCLVKARSTLKHTLRTIHRNVGEAEAKCTFSSALKFRYNQLPNISTSICTERDICVLHVNVICLWVCRALYGARGRPVPEAPVHCGYCFDSSGIMRELLLGCWEGKWQHSSLDPFLILGNPSWTDSRITHRETEQLLLLSLGEDRGTQSTCAHQQVKHWTYS